MIRIERTSAEAPDEASDEDEPTLSLSNPDLRPLAEGNAIGGEYNSGGMSPTTSEAAAATAAAAAAWRKRSTSESDTDREADSRTSRAAKRSLAGRQQKGFESTQSVDRCEKERSPVFFLDPEDWYRSEGSVPTVPLTASKLLASPVETTTLPTAVVARSESDENLDAELERISFLSETLRRTLSEIHCRSESCTPTFRPRSSTPGRGGWRPIREEPFSCDRNRKVAIPILYRRGALRVIETG